MICELFPVCIYVLFWFCFCAFLAYYFSQLYDGVILVVQCFAFTVKTISDGIVEQQTNKLNHCRLKM